MDGSVFRERASFTLVDYVIFGLTVAISSGVGIYFAISGGRQKTTSEYLVGDRKLHFVPVALSLIVSYESSILILGFPAEIYAHGTQFWMVHVGLPLTFLCIAQVVVPLIHPLRITSGYQYLELRYGSRAIRLLASALGIIYQTFYMGIVLFGPATALEAVSGFPVVYSIVLVSAATIFYTSIGGIKAVVWTDVLQSVIMLAGMLIVVIMGSLYVGGFQKMWQLNVDGGRVKFFDFNPNPLIRHTFWSLVFGKAVRSLGMGFNQSTIQRVVSLKTQREAKIVVWCMLPGIILFGTLACLEGMVSYAYFSYTGCDPYGAKMINNANQVLPYVVTDLFQNLPGLSGLFLASLFSASLSTLSSALSSISVMVWTDFLQPHLEHVSETTATIITKLTVVVFGAVSVGVAFLIKNVGGPLQQVSYSLLGSITGPLVGLFTASCIFPYTNTVGALVGTLISFGVCMWLSLGSSFSPYVRKTPYLPPAPVYNCYVNGTFNATMLTCSPPPVTNTTSTDVSWLTGFYSISYVYFGAVGIFTCLLVAELISICTGGCRTAKLVDPRYVVPLWDNLCCWMPRSWRRRLRFKGHSRLRLSRNEQNPEEQSICLEDTVT